MIIPFGKKMPKIDETVFVAPGARIIGDVSIQKGSSVWFNAVIRGDMNKIRIGKHTNLQDGAVVHVDPDAPCLIGDGVIGGHQATIHGCWVGDYVLVGIGSRILSHARIGSGSIIGAGAVVLEGVKIPPMSLVVGTPGKVIRSVTLKELKAIKEAAERYRRLAASYGI